MIESWLVAKHFTAPTAEVCQLLFRLEELTTEGVETGEVETGDVTYLRLGGIAAQEVEEGSLCFGEVTAIELATCDEEPCLAECRVVFGLLLQAHRLGVAAPVRWSGGLACDAVLFDGLARLLYGAREAQGGGERSSACAGEEWVDGKAERIVFAHSFEGSLVGRLVGFPCVVEDVVLREEGLPRARARGVQLSGASPEEEEDEEGEGKCAGS
jgi:hypothetical protein